MQTAQIENMIASGCKVLVIAAIDGSALTDVLSKAKAKNIPVIAYDRLIMNTDAVSYYATFDNYKVGQMQGQFVADSLNLASGAGPFNAEFFTGDPDDNNSSFLYSGAMSVLQPYLDNGQLVCPSGQTQLSQTATTDWSSDNAESRMEKLISTNAYSPIGTRLGAVICSNDSTANGVTTALKAAGYTGENFPIVTGQDCDIISVQNMISGTQAMSVFKDTRTLADKVVEMVQAILNGGTVPVNDTSSYDNGTCIIPAWLCAPELCTVDNYQNLLVDSGYYTDKELGIK